MQVRGEKTPFPVVDQVTVSGGEKDPMTVTVAVHKIDCVTMTVEGEHPIVVIVLVGEPAFAGPTLTRNTNPKTKRREKAHAIVLMLVSLLLRASPI